MRRSCGTDPVQCTGPRLLDRMSRSARVARLPYDFFSPQLAHWNAGAMAKSCRRLFAGELQPRHRQAAQESGRVPRQVLLDACGAFEAAVRDPAALYTSRTFAVHRWQCSWCREDATMLASVALRDVVFQVGNESAAKGALCMAGPGASWPG